MRDTTRGARRAGWARASTGGAEGVALAATRRADPRPETRCGSEARKAARWAP